MVVESAHLALGYFNDPDQTAAKFTALGNGRRRYRTGDLGRFDDDGQLYLLGRRDDAIKVRGYLVEPAEVEAAIRALPWATDVVVTADRAAGRLTAHVAVDPDKWSPSPSEIRQALSASLAPWMIPRDVVVLAELPRNERGRLTSRVTASAAAFTGTAARIDRRPTSRNCGGRSWVSTKSGATRISFRWVAIRWQR